MPPSASHTFEGGNRSSGRSTNIISVAVPRANTNANAKTVTSLDSDSDMPPAPAPQQHHSYNNGGQPGTGTRPPMAPQYAHGHAVMSQGHVPVYAGSHGLQPGSGGPNANNNGNEVFVQSKTQAYTNTNLPSYHAASLAQQQPQQTPQPSFGFSFGIGAYQSGGYAAQSQQQYHGRGVATQPSINTRILAPQAQAQPSSGGGGAPLGSPDSNASAGLSQPGVVYQPQTQTLNNSYGGSKTSGAHTTTGAQQTAQQQQQQQVGTFGGFRPMSFGFGSFRPGAMSPQLQRGGLYGNTQQQPAQPQRFAFQPAGQQV